MTSKEALNMLELAIKETEVELRLNRMSKDFEEEETYCVDTTPIDNLRVVLYKIINETVDNDLLSGRTYNLKDINLRMLFEDLIELQDSDKFKELTTTQQKLLLLVAETIYTLVTY